MRTVDIDKPSYKVAREYVIRLELEDFDDLQKLEKLARAASRKDSRLSPEVFKKQFEAVVTQLLGGF